MITRQALLIDAGIESCSDLPSELEATRRFLLSPAGGAWEEKEVRILRQPHQERLLKEVTQLEADYTITCFFGNSFPGTGDRHFLVLPNQDFIEDTDLINSSLRQVVLIDVCSNSQALSLTTRRFESSELQKARAMYDRWIQASEPGKIIMHGSEQATVSGDPRQGGLFMRKLLEVAHSITPTSNRFQLKSILAAGHETPDLLLEEGYESGPAITWSEGNIRLPFAMALPLPLPALPEKPFDKGFAIGLLLLGLLFNLRT